jgi:glycine oxidase
LCPNHEIFTDMTLGWHDPASTQTNARASITVVGAGIIGLWQALVLARAGYSVQLIERSSAATPTQGAASRYAGAMLSPDCEGEAAPPLVRDLGRQALAAWREVYPSLSVRGSLVVAAQRDQGELKRFARATQRHSWLDREALADLEPELGARFDGALHFADEAHMSAPAALDFLRVAVIAAGGRITYDVAATISQLQTSSPNSVVIDCRGYAARDELPQLRGVRGERVVVRARDVRLSRPVRLLHPRVPLYVVPWPDQQFMIGATVIESDDDGPMTVRSALELLGAAYALHTGFGEAEIIDLGAGVRPALADNVPRAIVRRGGQLIEVNGAFRHGFLLAPVLAQAVVDYIKSGRSSCPLLETN